MQQISFSRYAIETAASFPSTVARISARFSNHVDGVHGTLLEARPAAGAPVVVEPVAPPDAQLDDSLLGAGAEAAVTFEAVAARQASRRLVHGLLGREPPDDFVEGRHALLRRELGLLPPGVVAE